MLGVRLDPELDRRLTELAQQTHRSKSDVARAAIVDYLVGHDLAALAARQSALASAATTPDDYLPIDDRGWLP